MAGQPQEPSWQPAAPEPSWQPAEQEPSWKPAAPDQAQAREAWPPPPSFTPQPPASQDTYAYPPPTAYDRPAPAYDAPPTAYDQQAPAYDQQAPPAAQAAQAPQAAPGPGYPPPTYDAADQDRAQGQNQGMPQWQASPGMPRAGASRPRGEKGFIGSLFDFSFQSMVTPKIIKVLYVLLTVCIGLWALIFTVFCFEHAGAVAGFFVLIVLDPVYILLTLGVYRVVLEFVMITFRIHEDVQAIRAKGEGQL